MILEKFMSHSYVEALEKQIEVLREQVKLYSTSFDVIAAEVIDLRQRVAEKMEPMIPSNDPRVIDSVVETQMEGTADVTDAGNTEAPN